MKLEEFLKTVLVKQTYLKGYIVTEDMIVSTIKKEFECRGLGEEVIVYNENELILKQDSYTYEFNPICLNNNECYYLGTNIKKLMELYKNQI